MSILEILFVVLGILLLAVLFVSMRGDKSRSEIRRQLAQVGELAERLSLSHSELSGRMQQGHLDMNSRLEILSKRMGDGLNQQTEKTGKTLKELHER